MNQAWIESKMREGQAKDDKIRQLEGKARVVERRDLEYDAPSLDPIVPKPCSLIAHKSDLRPPILGDGLDFANYHKHSSANEVSRGSDCGPILMQAIGNPSLGLHFGFACAGGQSHQMTYELQLEARSDKWTRLFEDTVRAFRNSNLEDTEALFPVRNASIPISEFKIQTPEDLHLVGSAVRSEMKKFVEEHGLSQGILVTYALLSTTGDLIQTEIRLGRRKVSRGGLRVSP